MSLRESEKEMMRQAIFQCSFKCSQFDPILSVLRMYMSFMVVLHHYFHVLFLKSLKVVNSDNNTNNIFLLNHAQHLQRLFTFMTSSETLGKKDMWYCARFRDKSQKGQKRCEQPQVEDLIRVKVELDLRCYVSKSRFLSTLMAHMTSALSTTQVTPVSYDPEVGDNGVRFCHDVIALKEVTSTPPVYMCVYV